MKQEKGLFKFKTFCWDELNSKESWVGLKEECQVGEFWDDWRPGDLKYSSPFSFFSKTESESESESEWSF